MGSRYALAAVLPLVMSLGACESSSRLGSLLPDTGFRSAPRQPEPAPAPLTPAPSSSVESSSLPAPNAATAPIDPLPVQPGAGTLAAPLPQAPGVQGGNPQSPNLQSPGVPAPGTTRVVAAPSTPVAAPNRTGLIGNWSVSESSGGKCRMTLSSAPKLDLYGAASSGCQSKELQRVNAWELVGSEVILYEAGGGVVARLRQSGGQSYNGATAKSGAPVTLSK